MWLDQLRAQLDFGGEDSDKRVVVVFILQFPLREVTLGWQLPSPQLKVTAALKVTPLHKVVFLQVLETTPFFGFFR